MGLPNAWQQAQPVRDRQKLDGGGQSFQASPANPSGKPGGEQGGAIEAPADERAGNR